LLKIYSSVISKVFYFERNIAHHHRFLINDLSLSSERGKVRKTKIVKKCMRVVHPSPQTTPSILKLESCNFADRAIILISKNYRPDFWNYVWGLRYERFSKFLLAGWRKAEAVSLVHKIAMSRYDLALLREEFEMKDGLRKTLISQPLYKISKIILVIFRH